MIVLTQGNILIADTEAIVNAVNTVGVMGKGLALQFKQAFPENFRIYKEACERMQLEPGRMLVVENEGTSSPRYIINFPTKKNWRGRSKLEDIDAGLQALVGEITNRGIQSIAIPALGCGLGGLNWQEVLPRIRAAFEPLVEVRVVIYEPAK